MSGSRFGYNQWLLLEMAELIDEDVAENNVPDECGYQRDLSKRTIAILKKTSKILKEASVYVNNIDLLLSGDQDEKSFHKRVKEDLKEI